MRRRIVPPAARSLRASGDRWLFGYADVVTLLFACFASLYAMQTVTKTAAGPAGQDILLPRESPPSSLERDLTIAAGGDARLPGIEVVSTPRGIVISLPEAGSFPPGRADLSPAVEEVMRSLAATLRGVPRALRIEGHTDDVPIRTAMFASNWELSTARATRVLQFLIEDGAIDPTRLSAAGYGQYQPRLANDSAEARARNRRVDIVVLPSDTKMH